MQHPKHFPSSGTLSFYVTPVEGVSKGFVDNHPSLQLNKPINSPTNDRVPTSTANHLHLPLNGTCSSHWRRFRLGKKPISNQFSCGIGCWGNVPGSCTFDCPEWEYFSGSLPGNCYFFPAGLENGAACIEGPEVCTDSGDCSAAFNSQCSVFNCGVQ